jgi:hypothetical protein
MQMGDRLDVGAGLVDGGVEEDLFRRDEVIEAADLLAGEVDRDEVLRRALP